MVTQSHINSEFKDIAITDVNGNVIGANVQELVVSNIANFSLPGGISTQVLITADGAGNLDWETVGVSGTPETAIQGNSNIVVSPNGNITFSATGVANVLTISNTAVTFAGTANLGNVGNLLATGAPGVNQAVVGNEAGTALNFEQELLIPSGYAYGRMAARGKRIYRAGNSYDNNRVMGWWNYGDGYDVARQFPINNGPAPELKYFTKIHTNMSCAYALGDNGVLYVSGYDNNGQLGTGAANQSVSAMTAQLHPTLYGAGITVVDFWSYDAYRSDSVSIGACMVTVNDNGTFRTYTFGFNESGVLGNGTQNTHNHIPTVISQFVGKRPVSVSFLQWACLVVLDDGTVWGTGYNAEGQIGVGNTTTTINTFTQCKDSTNAFITGAAEVVTSYASGYGGVSFVRKTDGTLWGAGWGAANRLSQGPDVANKSLFTQVKTGASTFLTGIVKVVSSFADAMALDSTGQVWGWAGNWNNLWGNGEPANTPATYAKVIHTGVNDLWMPNSVYNTRCIFIRKGTQTFAASLNTGYQLGTVDISDPVTNISRVVFAEPGEYATHVARVGKRSETAETWYTAHMFKTNKNRVYIAGRFASYIGAFASIDYGSQPIEITDLV